MGFSATGKIDRREFGLIWNQALETGGVLVGNDIKINIEPKYYTPSPVKPLCDLIKEFNRTDKVIVGTFQEFINVGFAVDTGIPWGPNNTQYAMNATVKAVWIRSRSRNSPGGNRQPKLRSKLMPKLRR